MVRARQLKPVWMKDSSKVVKMWYRCYHGLAVSCRMRMRFHPAGGHVTWLLYIIHPVVCHRVLKITIWCFCSKDVKQVSKRWRNWRCINFCWWSGMWLIFFGVLVLFSYKFSCYLGLSPLSFPVTFLGMDSGCRQMLLAPCSGFWTGKKDVWGSRQRHLKVAVLNKKRKITLLLFCAFILLFIILLYR